jgi:hypothetical protein
MTRLKGKVDREKLSGIDNFGAQLDCLVSNNRFELMGDVVNKLETIKSGESVILSFVDKPEDAIDLICRTSE